MAMMENPSQMCIRRLLEPQVERDPEAIAIVAPGRAALTYGGLWRQVGETVSMLNAMGVGRNDRVALVLPNGPEMAVAFIAIAAATTNAPLNPAYRAREFDDHLSDLNARALVVQSGSDLPAIAVAQARGIPIIELTPVSTAPAGTFVLTGKQRAPSAAPGFAGPVDLALLVHTSGTTSRAKLVPLTQSNICAAAGDVCRSRKLSAMDRCLNVMPLFHAYGVVVTLSTLASGGSVVCTPGFDDARFFEWLDEFRPTWYTAVPTMHQAILARAAAHREIAARSSLRFISSSSSPLSARVRAELEDVFNAPVRESYGMTEAFLISTMPFLPRPRTLGSVGVAVGPEVSILDEKGQRLPHGTTGEIAIRGPSVMRGYENNPEANESAFTNGWFRTGDQGHLDEEGYLFISGRIKEIINRGGEKISPREVDEALMDHPAVLQAVTFAVPHPRLGEAVAAAVIVREGDGATEQAIRTFAAARLADFKVPDRVLMVDTLPKGPTGKLQRIGLAQTLGLTASASTKRTFVAPRDAWERQLAAIWEDTLGIRPIGIEDNYFDLGGHSLLGVRLTAQIEQTLGKRVPIAALFQAPTVEQLAGILREGRTVPDSSLVALQPAGSGLPLFCVPGQAGGVLHYRDLSVHLGPDQPVYGLLGPELSGEWRLDGTVEGIAARHVREILAFQAAGPYCLGGYSFGGVVAFEMAQQLLAQGQQVALLALFDSGAPGSGKRAPVMQRIQRHAHRVASLSPASRLPYVLESVRASALSRLWDPACRCSPRWAARWARAHQHDPVAQAHAHRRYVPKPYPGPIALFRTEGTAAGRGRDLNLGWNRLAAGGLEIHAVPGDHDTLIREPHVRVLAAKLSTCLEKARAEAPASSPPFANQMARFWNRTG